MKSWFVREALENTLKECCGADEQPKGLQDFMAGLNVLEGVPTEYLIPEAAVLPMETMQFFYVDEKWIHCLTDGALSVGRSSSFDAAHDRMLLAALRATDSSDSVRTGFMLRSKLVQGWPGLKIACYDTAGGNKKLLNIQKRVEIGEDAILVIVEGKIGQVELSEPAEGIRIGFSQESDITYRPGSAEGVVDIAAIAERSVSAGKATALELTHALLCTPLVHSVKGALL